MAYIHQMASLEQGEVEEPPQLLERELSTALDPQERQPEVRDRAIHLWVMTAFSEVPSKVLIVRCGLRVWKNSSIGRRALYLAAIVAAARCNAWVQHTEWWPVSGSQYPTR